MNATTLSLKLLTRQSRSGALIMLFAGLVVATAALAAVSLFTDRVGRALERQAGEVLAADLVVTGRERLPDEYLDKASELGLETAEIALLSTVLFVGEESHLVDLKAVTEGYPLRGQLKLADRLGAPEEALAGIPEPGTGWMAARGLRLFETDTGVQVDIGRRPVTIERVLAWEPDRGGSRFMLAPRLIIHMDDLLASELLGPGSRVRWRLLVAGSESGVAEFRRWVEPRLEERQDIETVAEAEADTGRALEQARRFLGVAALTAVILAAAAVLLAALRFSRSQRDLVALLKAFGAEGRQILLALTLLLLWLALAAIAVGGLLGFGAQAIIGQILADGPAGELPPARLLPLLGSGSFTLLLAAGFALPPLVALRGVAPMRILNRSLDTRPGLAGGLWLLPILGALTIPVLQLGNLRLAMIVLGGSAVLAALLALAAWLAMGLSRQLSKRTRADWRFGLAGLHRRRGQGIIQITALGLGLMALLLLMIVRTELLDQWRGSLPADTADHFVVNIQPDQTEGVREALIEAGAQNVQVRPMATVNLIEVNGEPPPDHRWAGQVNVSWIDRLPPANRVVEGEFFAPDATGEISLAKRWSERTGVGLGDTMLFEAGSRRFEATVTSMREVEWESFNVNFFILLTPSAGEALPHQFIASFRLPEEAGPLRAVQQGWPNVSIIDIGALLDRIGEIIDRVSRAAQVVFFFTLVAGLVVLLAALEATRDERRQEAALIRALGADDAMVRRGLLIEYGAMAFIAAVLATGGAALTGWLLARELFEFAYQPSGLLLVTGFLASFVLVIGSGWLGNRSVLRTSPIRILRAGG
ncbi:ABC transporter permease [Wenzhouxiangella sediminis]|uniref:Oxidoreductase n=1 Tax=Wenzhouxiangella sediminis TaxID=1792836 RepID=A0A3E1KA66_9GAMM|nr:FtsX-like permease family protein [Wenzhouxiangella sediminis]RFF31162.1 oxidoreductase [Wenzhouxiangella sediminis]